MLTSDEKKTIRVQLRELRGYVKMWTLKAPGLHIDQALVCPEPTHRLRGLQGPPRRNRRGLSAEVLRRRLGHPRTDP